MINLNEIVEDLKIVAADTVKEASSSVKDKAGEVTEKIKIKTGEALKEAEKIIPDVKEVVANKKDRAREFVEDTKTVLKDTLTVK